MRRSQRARPPRASRPRSAERRRSGARPSAMCVPSAPAARQPRDSRYSERAMDLDDVLVQEGVAAAREQIRSVLDRAAREGRHPAAALVEDGIVSEDLLAELLARACGTVVVDL